MHRLTQAYSKPAVLLSSDPRLGTPALLDKWVQDGWMDDGVGTRFFL